MHILSACIFSKSFGRKIKQFLNRCYREAFFKRLAHAYCSKFQNENKLFTFSFKSSLFGHWILILTRRILDKNVPHLFCTSEIKKILRSAGFLVFLVWFVHEASEILISQSARNWKETICKQMKKIIN